MWFQKKKRMQRTIDLFDQFANAYLGVVGAFIIWFVLLALLNEHFNHEAIEGYNFIWQIIGFTFVLAALCLAIDAPFSSKHKKTIFHSAGYLQILSGVGMIIGLGLGMFSDLLEKEGPEWATLLFLYTGMFLFLLSLFLISLSLSLMAFEAWKRVFN